MHVPKRFANLYGRPARGTRHLHDERSWQLHHGFGREGPGRLQDSLQGFFVAHRKRLDFADTPVNPGTVWVGRQLEQPGLTGANIEKELRR
jgi:hypothetical protein